MERPHGDTQPKQRQLTAELVYLDEMRRLDKTPIPFEELGDTAIQSYEDQAEQYELSGVRPDILDEYERHDSKPSEVVSSCLAMANELLTLKGSDSPFTFVDIAVEVKPATVIEKLRNSPVWRVLAAEDEQLAIPSSGEYYPVLDIRKQNARLVGVGLRVWGWDDPKAVFTNEEGEAYDYKQHPLIYPTNEQSSTRQFELAFGYDERASGGFSESVSLYIGTDGSATISSNVWVAEYAETGYEGHGGRSFDNLTDDDIAAFGDLIAEIVGDNPESRSMRIDRRLQEVAETMSPQERISLGPDSSWQINSDSEATKRIREGARRNILSHPYFEALEVKKLLGTDDLESLVDRGKLLAYKDHGDFIFPAFQFDPDTNRPNDVVSQVNIILDAPNGGWGVTAWWVQTNGWLSKNTAPKDLLRTPNESELIDLAKELLEDY